MLTTEVSILCGMNTSTHLITVGDRLKASREQAGLSQTELATEIGATRSAIAQVESGISTSLNAENLAKAAQRLGKSAVWLATGQGEENSTELIGEMMADMPEDDRQQVFDFILYKLEKATPHYAEEKTATRYADMIERIKADMIKRKAQSKN